MKIENVSVMTSVVGESIEFILNESVYPLNTPKHLKNLYTVSITNFKEEIFFTSITPKTKNSKDIVQERLALVFNNFC